MLRSSSSRNYVCWRCLSLSTKPAQRALRRIPPPTGVQSSPKLSVRRYSSVAATAALQNDDLLSPPESGHPVRGIRDRLRTWEEENLDYVAPAPDDDSVPPDTLNVLTGSRTESSFRLELPGATEELRQHDLDSADLVDLGLTGDKLQAGDLVEVGAIGLRIRLLAVCLGSFNGLNHFYTHTGKWFTSRDFRSGFVVKKFISDPSELQPIIAALPSHTGDQIVLDELQELKLGPSRDVASSVIHKLYRFQTDARLIHQTYVERLSNPSSRLSGSEALMSIHEIADALLPHTLKRNKNRFSPEVLYAVYSVVWIDDIAFRALSRAARHQEAYLFAVNSAQVQKNILKVEELLRNFYDVMSSKNQRLTRASANDAMAFRDFVLQARKVIDQSRKTRAWSPPGIGTYKSPAEDDAPSTEPVKWSKMGSDVLDFMEYWSASNGFPSASRYHWVGASVLRVIDRYSKGYPDVLLGRTTAWAFLQEVGRLPPWDIPSRHSLRLPGIEVSRHAGLNLGKTQADTPFRLPPDQLEHLRQDFARSTVYCIDSEQTLDVDDGVSLETIGNGEHWVHVHVADPASSIRPDHPLAERAASRGQSSYLAGFNEPMFPHDAIREAFSLGANRPSLTFSARVDEAGNLLDYKITPGILRDVVYITPEDVDSICEADRQAENIPSDVLEVGIPPKGQPPRKMVRAKDMSRAQRAELKTLYKIAQGFRQARLTKGAMPLYRPKPKAHVSLESVDVVPNLGDVIRCKGDPYIRVAYESSSGSELVGQLMVLAGEVAARWCSERNIPIPYRVQLSSAESMKALEEFSQSVVYPALLAGERLSAEDNHKFRTLMGGFDMATKPHPIFNMGVDAYAKVTSPLRRYSDLLAHWQIEAALLEEHRKTDVAASGSSSTEEVSVAAKKSSKPAPEKSSLPFSAQDLEDHVMPLLRVRERYGKLIDNVDGNNTWIIQALLRAWQGGEAASSSQLPETFKFTTTFIASQRFVVGTLDYFDLWARIEVDDLGEGMRMAEVLVGDVFRVVLSDINVHDRRIRVKVLEKIAAAPPSAAETELQVE